MAAQTLVGKGAATPSVSGPSDADEAQESLFPHTPRLDDRCFDAAPPDKVVRECLRPGTCCVDEPEQREWLHRQLVAFGFEANSRGQLLMAHSWFQCGYAARGTLSPDAASSPRPG